MRKPGRPSATATDAGSKKEEIAKVAGRHFAKSGFAKTTIRLIASDAGVDPKLVMHYFRSKERLFAETLSLPFDPKRMTGLLSTVPTKMWGSTLARLLYLRSPKGVPVEILEGVIRAAASHDEATQVLREFYRDNFFGVFRQLNLPNAEIKAVAVSSILAGFVFTERVINVQSLTNTSTGQRQKLLATLIQAAIDN